MLLVILPKVLINYILTFVNEWKHRRVCKLFKELITNNFRFNKKDLFWIGDCKYDFIVEKFIKQMEITQNHGIYKQILNKGTAYAFKFGCTNAAKIFIKEGGQCTKYMLFDACFKQNYELLNILFEKGINKGFKHGLNGACVAGNINLVNLMLSKGASDYNWALVSACSGGNMDIAKLMIAKGATSFNNALFSACGRGHLHIINMLIEHGADDFDNGLAGACRGGQGKIASLMINKGASDFNNALTYACEGGHYKIVKFLECFNVDNWKGGFYHACSENRFGIIRYILDKKYITHTEGFLIACGAFKKKSIIFIKSHWSVNIDLGIDVIKDFNNSKFVEFLQSLKN